MTSPSEMPDFELFSLIMRSTSPAVDHLQKLLGIRYELERPAQERAELMRGLAGHLRELAKFADVCDARAAAVDYVDGEAVVEVEIRALPRGSS